jgi:hypothetical protein
MDTSGLNEFARILLERIVDEFPEWLDDATLEKSDGNFLLVFMPGFKSKTGEDRRLSVSTGTGPDKVIFNFAGWDAVVNAEKDRYGASYLDSMMLEDETGTMNPDIEESILMLGHILNEKLVVSVNPDKVTFPVKENMKILEVLRSWNCSYDRIVYDVE